MNSDERGARAIAAKSRQQADAMFSKFDRIKQMAEIQAETIRRLLDREDVNLPELAELFEDIGNVYLNLSEEIRHDVILEQTLREANLTRLIPAPLSVRALPEEEREDSDLWKTTDYSKKIPSKASRKPV